MRDWLESLSARDQLALAGGGVALGVILLVLLVWQPLARDNERLAAEAAERGRDLSWMRTAAVEIKALESAKKKGVATDDRTLIARVTTELRTDKIEATQIRPEGEERLRLTLKAVSFTALLASLERLQSRYGIGVREAAMEPSTASGLVDAQIVLQRGGTE